MNLVNLIKYTKVLKFKEMLLWRLIYGNALKEPTCL